MGVGMPGLGKKFGQVLQLSVAALVGVVLDANANAVDHKSSPLAGDYMIYSGALDDTNFPKRKDAKVSITITGKLAADMFRYLGASAKTDYCLNAKETEARAKNDLICIAGGDSGVECHIGIDILKGRSINGLIC
jgi:hypothetical protein